MQALTGSLMSFLEIKIKGKDGDHGHTSKMRNQPIVRRVIVQMTLWFKYMLWLNNETWELGQN
jgi:hypothetical protein